MAEVLRPGFEPPKVHLNILSNWGGMGDMIARLPAIRWGLEKFPHVSMTVYWQDYFLPVAELLLPETNRLKHKKLSQENEIGRKEIVLDFDPNRITSLGLHLTAHGFLSLYDRLPEREEDMFYPQADWVPEILGEAAISLPYVVFTVAHTAQAREWPAYEVNKCAEEVAKRGYTPVLIGSTERVMIGEAGGYIKGAIDDDLDRSLFVDLTNRTTLIEALAIMQRASAVLGVDNGLLHLAHCTSTPVIAGFTSVESRVRIPHRAQGRTISLDALVPCNGCQSKTYFINHDFRTCLFNDYACTLTMTSERFIKGLDSLEI